MNDNPILRPVENGFADIGWTRDGLDVSGRASNPHLLVFTRCSVAVELPSSITEAQRPIRKGTTDKEASWESIGCPMVRGLNALAVSRFTDNPNSTARRKWHSRWESNPHLPKINPGVLSQLNYGVIRWASGAADMGLRKRDSNPQHWTCVQRLSHGEQPPLFCWRDNLRTSAHQK